MAQGRLERAAALLVVTLAAGLAAGWAARAGLGGGRGDTSTVDQDESGRTGAERQAVLGAQRRHSGLRMAADGDGAASGARDEVAALYVDYHPYFVRGDLDGDGCLDFAQAFVREPGPFFDVAVFFGQTGGGFSGPRWVERGISLARGDLSVERSLLIVTPDLGTDDVRRWRFEPGTNRFVPAEPEPEREGDGGGAADPHRVRT